MEQPEFKKDFYVANVVDVVSGNIITCKPLNYPKETWTVKISGVDVPDLKRPGYWPEAPYASKAVEFVKSRVLHYDVLVVLESYLSENVISGFVMYYNADSNKMCDLASEILVNGLGHLDWDVQENTNHFNRRDDLERSFADARWHKRNLHGADTYKTPKDYREVHTYLSYAKAHESKEKENK